MNKPPPLKTKVINGAVYEIIPTEKGYSYLICISMCIVMTTLYSHFPSLGMMYNDFLKDIGAGVKGLTIIVGVNLVFISFSGIITNVALKRFSIRQVGLFGAFFYTIGWISTTFVQSLGQMIFTYGFLVGMSTGIVFTIGLTSFNIYFITRKKTVVMNICQIFISSYTMILPFIIKYLLEEYGYRGTQLIMAAVMGHTIFAVVCMQPIEWHAEKKLLYHTVKERDNSERVPLEDTKMYEMTTIIEKEKDNSERVPLKDTKMYEMTTIIEKEKEDEPSVECGLNGDKPHAEPVNKLKSFIAFLDISLLKDIIFVNLMVGLIFGMMIDLIFFSIFPSHLYSLGLHTGEVAKCLSILGGCDLAGRMSLVVFTKYFTVRNEVIFYYGVLFTTVARIGFLFCTTATSFNIIMIFIGFCRALILSPYTLVFAEYAPDKFPAAIGLGMLTYGCVSLPLMTFIGYLYERTNNHVMGYLVLTGLNAVTVITWTVKLLYFRRKANKT